MGHPVHVPGGAAPCSERFCKMLSESSPRLFDCTAATLLPQQARRTFRKRVTKPSEQVAAPPGILPASKRVQKSRKSFPVCPPPGRERVEARVSPDGDSVVRGSSPDEDRRRLIDHHGLHGLPRPRGRGVGCGCRHDGELQARGQWP